MANNDESLTGKDKRDLVIEAGLQLIPSVGGALSTLYFGTKQEKRFKRLESFYEELASDINRFNLSLPGLQKENEEELIAIIEQLNEKIETENRVEKREFFKRYFINLLSIDNETNYDQKRYFLDILDSLNIIDIQLLKLIQDNKNVLVSDIKGTEDVYEIVGSIGRLKNYGFLYARTGRIAIGSDEDNTLNEVVSISSFGEKFINFCIG